MARATSGSGMPSTDAVSRGMASGAQTPPFFSAQVSQARRFYLDLRPSPKERLVVVSGGCEHCSADYEIHRAGFPYLSVEFVASGEGRLTLCGRDYALRPGTLFSYGPRVPHRIRTDPHRRLVKYFVDFAGNGARPLLRESALAPGAVGQTSSPAEIMSILEELIRNGLRGSTWSPRLCSLVLEQLLLKIAETATPAGSSGHRAFATYQHARELLQEQCLQFRTLEDAARACHLDVAYLCRLFRRFDRQSPYQCLLRFRMNHAADLLQRRGALVKQVSDELGFADPYHFSHVFKRVFGLSPLEFVRLRRDEPFH